MRFVNGFFALMMLGFIGVQYNDPDGPFWMLIYGVPVICAALAAVRPGLLREVPGRIGMAICLVAAVVATIVFWPTDAFWWRQEVWWESEAAREGMGLMIATVVIAIAGLTCLGGGRGGDRAEVVES